MWIAVNTSQRRGEKAEVKQTYLDAIRYLGHTPLILHPKESYNTVIQKLNCCRGLILIGGPDIPAEFYGGRSHPTIRDQEPQKVDRDFFLIRTCIRMSVPILGICAGMQLLGCYFGGTMFPHIPEAGRETHQLTGRHGLVKISNALRSMVGLETWEVNSRHHQCLATPGELRVEAESPDGFIEAVSHPRYPIWGVQWHPEDMIQEQHSYGLFCSMLNGYGTVKCRRPSALIV